MISQGSHTFSTRQIFTLAVGPLIGIGWITVLGSWLADAGSVGAMLAFLVGGVFMLPIVFCYAEIASRHPAAGGEIAYARRYFGRPAAFVAGWLLAFTYIAVCAFEAISVGWIAGVLVPALKGPKIYSIFGHSVYAGEFLTGLVALTMIAFANYRGAHLLRIFQDTTTFLKLGGAVIFILLGLLFGKTGNLEPYFIEDAPFAGFMAVLVTAPFWFAGFNAAVQAIGDDQGRRNTGAAGRALVAALLVAILFYCGIVAASAMAMPRADLLASELPTAAAFEAVFNSRLMRDAVLVTGLMGLLSTWNAIFLAATRVLAALAEDGWLPTAIAQKHPAHQTPVGAVVMVGLLTLAGMLFGRSVVLPAVSTSSICLSAMFTLVAFATLQARQKYGRDGATFSVPGGTPVIVIASLLSSLMLLVGLMQPALTVRGVPGEWLTLGGWLLVGGALFWERSARGVSAAGTPAIEQNLKQQGRE